MTHFVLKRRHLSKVGNTCLSNPLKFSFEVAMMVRNIEAQSTHAHGAHDENRTISWAYLFSSLEV